MVGSLSQTKVAAVEGFCPAWSPPSPGVCHSRRLDRVLDAGMRLPIGEWLRRRCLEDHRGDGRDALDVSLVWSQTDRVRLRDGDHGVRALPCRAQGECTKGQVFTRMTVRSEPGTAMPGSAARLVDGGCD